MKPVLLTWEQEWDKCLKKRLQLWWQIMNNSQHGYPIILTSICISLFSGLLLMLNHLFMNWKESIIQPIKKLHLAALDSFANCIGSIFKNARSLLCWQFIIYRKIWMTSKDISRITFIFILGSDKNSSPSANSTH